MPTHNDETLHDRYAREHADHMARLAKMTPEQIAEMELSLHNAMAEVDRLRANACQGGEAVAWHTDDHLTDKSATTYDREVAERWRAKGWPVTPLHYTHVASQEPHKNEVNGLKRDLKKKEVCDGSGS